MPVDQCWLFIIYLFMLAQHQKTIWSRQNLHFRLHLETLLVESINYRIGDNLGFLEQQTLGPGQEKFLKHQASKSKFHVDMFQHHKQR